MPDLVSTKISDAIATVTMNRPEVRNALSRELIDALAVAIDAIDCEADVRVMILSGAGKTFSAGMDLKGVMADPEGMRPTLEGLSRVMRKIRRLPIPTIARVQAAAIGGGCGLMVVTDFSVTHPHARIGYPEVSLGLSPAVVAPWLIKKIGPGRARAMLLAGRTVSGQEAYEFGLVTHLAQRRRLEQEAAELAARLAEGSPPAMATTKRWVNELDGSLDDTLLAKGAALSADVIASAEAQARLRARFGPA
ncbi:MAG: enoyl-CoA hydratase/isomerase family protein [Planctomycetota bacterium]|jgi:methylglutaconyl-CoA hydratase